MADTSQGYAFFYNSVKRDRVYNADSFSEWLRKFFTTGVFIGDLQVLAGEGMQVTVGAGYCNIEGKVKMWTDTSLLDIARPDATYDRIDTVVAERNDSYRDFVLRVITGTASKTPAAKVPVRENGIYQLVLGQIHVPAGSTKVVQANITDTRPNKDLCGFVASTVDQIDFGQIQAQFDSYMAVYKEQVEKDCQDYIALFNAWFERMRGQLDEDPAGHLQLQLDELAADVQLFEVTLAADGWTESDTDVWTQTADCPDLLASYDAQAPETPATGNKAVDAARKEALDILCAAGNYGETLDGALKWTCYGEKPAVNLPLRLRAAVLGTKQATQAAWMSAQQAAESAADADTACAGAQAAQAAAEQAAAGIVAAAEQAAQTAAEQAAAAASQQVAAELGAAVEQAGQKAAAAENSAGEAQESAATAAQKAEDAASSAQAAQEAAEQAAAIAGGEAVPAALRLAAPRKINGTDFDGTADITTASWGGARNISVSDASGSNTGEAVSVDGGADAALKLPATIKAALDGNAGTATKLATARTITIGSKGKTFDGSGNVSWTLDEIGAPDAAAIKVFTCTLLASGWAETAAGSGVYEQTAACTGMQAAYDLAAPEVPATGVKATDTALKEGLDVLCAAGNCGETLAGQIKWTCYDDKPAVDLPLRLRRVVV